jgi:hypothetical protein
MSQAQPSEKKVLRYAYSLFEMNSHKEGAMWHEDPLLGNDQTQTRQQPKNSNRGTVFLVWSVLRCYKQDSRLSWVELS